MLHKVERIWAPLSVLLLGAGATWSLWAADDAEPPGAAASPAAAKPAAQQANSKYLGVSACARCHLQPTPEDTESAVTDFVSLNEYKTWTTHDKHSQAYERLVESERTKSMERLLKIDAKTEASCLACHAIHATPEQADASFRVQRGVSCEACHGASSRWVDPHWKSDWRSAPSAAKTALGMIDVRDPAVRTQLCLSCHLGDVATGKVVTHEMYAAGHPPLPGFELETFASAMPAHWRHTWDKPPAVQQQLGYQAVELPQTKLVLTSGLGALRGAVALLGEQAQSDVRPWPELALYDCQACHHDLQSPSWRQRRGFVGQPGRPSLHSWPLALAELGAGTTGKSEHHVAQLLRPLTRALDQQAFGSRTAVAAAADEVLGKLDEVIVQVAAKPLTQADARALLLGICHQASAAPVDYDSARQLAWAWLVIYGELPEQPTGATKIAAVVKQIQDQLSLKLLRGRKTADVTADGEPLSVVNRYDPAEFQANMAKLKALVDAAADEPVGE